MNLRILKRRNVSTDPAHVPTDPRVTVIRKVEQDTLRRCLHILEDYDPNHLDTRRWLLSRGLPLNHRDGMIWAELEKAHHVITRIEREVA